MNEIRKNQITPLKLIACVVVLIAVFLNDIFSDNEIIDTNLYLLIALSALLFENRTVLFFSAGLAIILLYTAYFITPHNSPASNELIQRGMVAILIIVVNTCIYVYVELIILPKSKIIEMKRIVKENEQLLYALHNSALVSITDRTGIITFANENFCAISKYSQSELIGSNHRILKSGKQPDGLFVGMWAAISSGRIWRGEICNKAKDGSFYWVYATIIPTFNLEGRIEKYIGIRFDITPLKVAEENLILKSKELKRSNEELQKFAHVASHDLQEPLRKVSSYTQLLERRYGDQLDDNAKEYIYFAVEGANRMQQLIKDLLDYSRVSTKTKPFTEVDCNKILSDVRFNLSTAIEETQAEIIADNLPVINGDESQLLRLFQNLISNALKFVVNKHPVVNIKWEELEDSWKFWVIDNGIGIDQEYAERVFVIFQRLHTRQEFKGSGMGLAISKRIVERHNGEIWFEPNPEGGTQFIFTISKNLA